MARNRRSKRKHTTRKEKNACTISHVVAGFSTDDKEFSGRLSLVLDKLAVNEHLIQFRRRTMLSYEREMTLKDKALGGNRQTYIFGSQIEGTTTAGMKSDVDHLFRFNMFRLFLDSETPPIQPHDHQVVIKVSTQACASQYCCLTMIEPSTQAMRFKQLDPDGDPVDLVNFFHINIDWRRTDGKIGHTIMFDALNHLPEILQQAKRHGPAESIYNMDSVYACYCNSLPKQCKFVFERPRPGHWPTKKTLNKAKKYGVFIVPQGPPKNTNICTKDDFDYQWRISTNLTERLLMFSLDTVHMKAYVLTKMIRKELFVPEYRDRLSTFHFKTALLFAVENTRPDEWTEDNLIKCVKNILATLRRFLKRRYCPHFTIENVNLFDGKIERREFPKLVDKITCVSNSLRTKIENIQMDNIGKTLIEFSTANNERNRTFTNNSALLKAVLSISYTSAHYFYGFEFSDKPVNERMVLIEIEQTRLENYYRAPLEKYRKYDYALYDLISTLACMGASAYLEQKTKGLEFNHAGINRARKMYSLSLESDIIGNYMRYASFLFCNREYDEACIYFDLIEKQIEEDKTSNLIFQFFVSPSESLALQIAKQSHKQSFKQIWSVFLIFRPAEAMCVPEFLRYEMYRASFGDSTSGFSFPFYSRFGCICVQIEPYLYYLQYVTYRKLHKELQQSKALMKLSTYTEIIKPTRLISECDELFLTFAHFDTSLNMLGHCLELEQKLKSAWKTYTTSLHMVPDDNASLLHIIRLLWKAFKRQRIIGHSYNIFELPKQTSLLLDVLCDLNQS
ncbi:uncharacterized protein LOC127853806 [Dreissena polymorpha]|uniref:Mab-21-like HhH/H2TH-like domain-containing protein n=1 Tax=Dreissena polymorpha TaxID=45954 RepID=A0A9D4CL30_DREPO|nr:uncharacterized protein LOC127853806 [Dreissena polymorpha]XP_052244547.1 uncharacterized protein LOC127853806 [Dreissena polymorpha]KAH3727353.1 hypothetical protein DPMN_053287 [Dreissena polymorpha]